MQVPAPAGPFLAPNGAFYGAPYTPWAERWPPHPLAARALVHDEVPPPTPLPARLSHHGAPDQPDLRCPLLPGHGRHCSQAAGACLHVAPPCHMWPLHVIARLQVPA